MARRLAEAIDRFLNWGAERASAESFETTYRIGFGRALLVSVGPSFLAYAVHFYLVGYMVAALLMLIGAVAIGVGIALMAWGRLGRDWTPWYYAIVFAGVFAPLVLHDVEVIWLRGRLEYLGWVYLYPPLAFFLLGGKRGLALAGSVVVLIGIGLAVPHPGTVASFDAATMKTQLVVSLLATLAVAAIYERTRSVTQSRHMASERKLRDANVALEAATAEARRASNAKTEFLAQMSHELRTPLNHIVGFTQLVLDECAGPISDLQREYLGHVASSSQHLLSLINDMLDLTKVEAGKLELEKSDVILAPLLQECASAFGEPALRRGVTIVTDTARAPERIIVDERRLRQIVSNLLSNAIKFTPPGGAVTVRAEIRAESVGGAPLHLTVTDNGVGIEASDLERIFLPFEQAGGGAGSHTEGTGLGLPLTRKLVEAHGGRTWAESEGRGKGSTFHVELPQA